MHKSAVFFDRDDTLIRDVPYLGDPKKVRLMPGTREALQHLRQAGFVLFIVSNQSGVGRGVISADQVSAVNAELIRKLGDAFFEAIYLCYAAPGEDDHNCRKPNPGMLYRARDEFQIDLTTSWFIGDKIADMQCARHAGCHALLVRTGQHDPAEIKEAEALAEFAADDLLEAAQYITSSRG